MFRLILQYPMYFTAANLLQTRAYQFLDEFFTQLQFSALCRSQRAPKEFRDTLRNEKLRRLLKSAACLPFWREKITNNILMSQDTVGQLRTLPILTKDDLRKTPIEDRTSKEISEKFGIRNYTSGSTGEPISFYTDKRLRTNIWAVILRIAGTKKISKRSVIHLWPSSNLNYSFQNHFSVRTMEELHEKRKEIYSLISRPKSIVFGFSSILRFLSDMAKKDNVTLRPDFILVAGEALTPEMHLFLQNQFHCKIVNVYGCNEISVMAGEW